MKADRDETRSVLEKIRRAALDAVEPSRAVRRVLALDGDRLLLGPHAHQLAAGRPVRLVAAGKGAPAMAAGAAAVLGDRVGRGVVVTRRGDSGDPGLPPCLRVFEAGHPVPDAGGERAAAAIEEELRQLTPDDTVLLLLSGGASALLADPAEPLTLADLQGTTDALLRSGASIGEVNSVRKHLSRLKGGQLARLARPAWLGVLVLSDVVGDPLDVIASGPAAPDPTTFSDAWKVLAGRGLLDALPSRVLDRLRLGLAGEVPETPKPGDPVFERVLHAVVGSNRLAALAAAGAAERLGYRPILLTTFLEGEAREAARFAAALARGVLAHGDPIAAPACLVLGGETTVTVRGAGRGGRNQELALAAALAIEGIDGVAVMALATDGSDGPTDASGAIVDGETAGAVRAAGLDPAAALRENDSYAALDAAGALLRTGATGTNVNDLLVVLVEKPLPASTAPLATTSVSSPAAIGCAEKSPVDPARGSEAEPFRLLFHSAPLTSVLYRLIRDEKGEVVDWEIRDINRLGAESLGMPAADLIGKRASGLFGDPVLKPYLALCREVLASGSYRQVETTFETNGRSYLTALFATGADLYANVSVDITDRIRAGQELRASEERHRQVVAALSEGVAVQSSDGRIVTANPAAERVLGLTVDQLLGRTSVDPAWRAIHEDGSPFPGEEHPAMVTLRTGAPVRDVVMGVHKPDGSLTWICVSSAPLQKEGETAPSAVVTSFRDVTAARAAEEARLGAQKREALGILAGGIAHDFNNILLAIRGNAMLAAADLPPGSPTHDFVAEIDRASVRAAGLVGQILTFARPEEPKRTVEALGPVVNEALKLLRSTLPAGIEIEIGIEIGSEAAGDVPLVAVDSGEVHQIVVNLVTNAAHAIGSRPGRIEISLSPFEGRGPSEVPPGLPAGRYARVSVRDDGCGMDAATSARAFDPFFTTKALGQGTGLGLSIVYRIMRSYGGTIVIQSEPGRGTVCDLYFPAAAAREERGAAPASESGRGRMERLLVVDDDDALVLLYRHFLGRLGYRVAGFNDPGLALTAFRENPDGFDAVVTDISMPQMSGFDLAREIQAFRPDVPVVVTSGYIRPEDEEAARELRIRALIRKPDTIDDLAATLDEIFGGRG